MNTPTSAALPGASNGCWYASQVSRGICTGSTGSEDSGVTTSWPGAAASLPMCHTSACSMCSGSNLSFCATFGCSSDTVSMPVERVNACGSATPHASTAAGSSSGLSVSRGGRTCGPRSRRRISADAAATHAARAPMP